MFKRLVSQLSLSPSAVSQLAFYGRRLARQGSSRRLTAVAAVLLVVLQSAVVLFPPTATNAASPGDVIYGGIVSKADLLNRYDESLEIQALYSALNLNRSDLDRTAPATISSSDHTLKVLGRIAHAADEFEITAGGHTYYMQPLYVWDTAGASDYGVLQGVRADGSFFAILTRSGDPVLRTYPPVPIAATPNPALAMPTLLPTPSPTPMPTPAAIKKSAKPAVSKPVVAGVHTTLPTPTPTPLPPPPPSYTRSKTAVNLTQNIDATTRPAAGGDSIRYHLITKNTGGSAGDYTVVEHLQDILEYADLTDPNGAALKGNVLTWPAQTVLPGGVLTTEFTVRIKNPIPATPIGLSDKYSYDLRLDNVYGNTVRINLTPPAAKQLEIASASLPPANPPVATAIILLICLTCIYFYLRNRQLQIEVKLLRGEYEGGL